MRTVRVVCLSVLGWLLCASFCSAQSYTYLWKQVEQAREKSLPQTVIKLAEEICRKAEKEQNAPQLLRGTVCLQAYRESRTPDSLYTHLRHLEQWAADETNAASRAIVHSLLAERYADYLQSHRGTLLSRTELDVEQAPADIREWTPALFVEKVDGHLRASLDNPSLLADTRTTAYLPFVIQEENSALYGHDLLHLLVRRAVECYNGLRAFAADTLLKARVEEVYVRKLMDAYRMRKGAEDALLLASIDYEVWKSEEGIDRSAAVPYYVLRQSAGELSLATLDRLIEEHAAREICAEAYIRKAELLESRWNDRRAEAVRVCDEGIRRYPSYRRIGALKNIRTRLLAPELSVNLQTGVYPYPGDSVEVEADYRNLGGFTLAIYTTDAPATAITPDSYDRSASKYRRIRQLFSAHYALRPLAKGREVDASELPYLSCDTTFRIPVPDAPGAYIVLVVPDVPISTQEKEGFLSVSRLKVLSLALPDNKVEIVTLDGKSGRPVPDVTLRFYSVYNAQKQTLLKEVRTDGDGKVLIDRNSQYRYYVASKGSDRFMQPQSVSWYVPSGQGDRKLKRVTLLTDRSLYRPGQTIHVKGIAYEQTNRDAAVLENATYRLRLLDANRKELSAQEVRTNEFGSFVADFALPSSCLNGIFRIEAVGAGSTSVRVEEYKRPSFEITFDPVREAYRLGDKIVLRGMVKSFSGVSVQQVPMAYTVKRSDMLSSYWSPGEKPLVADTIHTDAQGRFELPLSLSVPAVDGVAAIPRAVYSFTVSVAVTTDDGETQEAVCNLMAGDRAFSVDVSLPSALCKDDTIFTVFQATNRQQVPLALDGNYRLYRLSRAAAFDFAPRDPEAWQKEKPVLEGTFRTGERCSLEEWRSLPSGNYRLTVSARDSPGREEENQGYTDFLLFSRQDTRLPRFTPFFCHEENVQVDEDHPGVVRFGTSYKDAYVFLNIFTGQGRVESRVLQLSDSIVCLELPYKEAYGEQMRVNFTFVKDGHRLDTDVNLTKRRPECKLDMKWEVFRNRLQPGQQEEWKLVVKTPQGFPAAAEVLATMYDASLDKIFKNNQSLGVFFNRYLPYMRWEESNWWGRNFHFSFPAKSWKVPGWSFDYFYRCNPRVTEELLIVNDEAAAGEISTRISSLTGSVKMRSSNAIASKAEGGTAVEIKYVPTMVEETAAVDNVTFESEELPMENLRTNFSETAFFYPQLRTNEQGEVAFTFTVPQSLTRWNFRGYSHTKDMMTGMLDASVVTAKEFMLTPNMPRFVRTGDETQIAGTIANLTDKAVKGTALFTLFDPMTERVIATQRRKFSVEAGRTVAIDFRFHVSDRYDLLGVRMVADGGTFSDGEQHLLPVLSNKEYITETLAMPVRGEETRTFSLDSLFNRDSRTATDRRLTVEFTGNPAWYAVQALPALSLPANDNAVSWATAWYANSLAGFIANSQPRIKTVFDSWKAAGGTKETFLSRLEKNQEVKNILLSESPWVLEATTEAEQQARIATLFDINQLNDRNLSAFAKLKELQGEDGGWSWYKGMSASRSITGYITELLVRLPLLTKNELPEDVSAMRRKAFAYLNREALEEYRNIRKAEKNGAKITANSEPIMTYLYLIALSGEQVSAENQAAYRYFLSKVGTNLKEGTMSGKAQSAIILKAAGRTAETNDFIASFKEHLVQTDELGAYFAFQSNPYNWGMLPIPAHVEVMEALRMAGGNDALVEEMKLWLLKQKQTTAWNSPVATADAVYALLCQGANLLESRGDVRITLGSKVMETLSPATTTVPGLGYVKETFTQGSTELKAKAVTVEKRDAGIAWGAVYAQYLSPISDVRQQGKELNVEKKLYVERVAADGSKSLQAIAEGALLSVGDKVVARLTILLDRAMDFVQLKDQRGACFEPIGSLSGYRWSNGLDYYAEVEDAATHFFFDHLGKGVYVLEHSYRIARGGTYETGLATVQCAYAPEYASHSGGGKIVIK